jgi:hypothetical protein
VSGVDCGLGVVARQAPLCNVDFSFNNRRGELLMHVASRRRKSS